MIEIGNLSVSGFIFFWMIGIICSQIYYVIEGRKYKLKWYYSLGIGLMILFFEIVSAKLLFLLENIQNLSRTSFALTGGYSLFGVFLFMPFILILLSKYLRNDSMFILNFSSIGILIELAVYRIGCKVVGCCGGITINNYQIPTQIIECIIDAIIAMALIVLQFKNKIEKNGVKTSLVFISYGFIRFIIEFFRIRENIIGPFSISHIFAIITIIIGIVIYYLYNIKKCEESKK